MLEVLAAMVFLPVVDIGRYTTELNVGREILPPTTPSMNMMLHVTLLNTHTICVDTHLPCSEAILQSAHVTRAG